MEARVLQHELRGEGDPLVLVPGGLTGWLSWVPHAERLAESLKTVRVQPIHNELGSAGQPGDPDYTAEIERESLRLTLEELGIEAADFSGWSGGARALIEFALAYPEKVRTLTLVEPAAYWLLEQLGQEHAEVERLDRFMHGLAGREVSDGELGQFLRMAGFIGAADDPRDHPNWPRWLPHRMSLSWQSEAVDRSGRSLKELSSITCPVLLVKGAVTAEWLKRVVDVLGDLLPNATVLELPGDHACHIQSIDDFLDALLTHIRVSDRRT